MRSIKLAVTGALRRGLALYPLVSIARFDESALGFERVQVGPGKLLTDFAKRRFPRCKSLDQPLVDGDSFPVQLCSIGLWDVAIAVDKARQMHRHQPPRV